MTLSPPQVFLLVAGQACWLSPDKGVMNVAGKKQNRTEKTQKTAEAPKQVPIAEGLSTSGPHADQELPAMRRLEGRNPIFVPQNWSTKPVGGEQTTHLSAENYQGCGYRSIHAMACSSKVFHCRCETII